MKPFSTALVVQLALITPSVTAQVTGYTVLAPDALHRVELPSTATTLVGPIGYTVSQLAVSPAGVLYGIDLGTDQLIAIDPATAVGSLVGSIGFDLFGLGGLTFAPDGTLWASGRDRVTNSWRLLLIDASSGLTTNIGPTGSSVGLVWRGGQLIAARGNQLFEADTATAALTPTSMITAGLGGGSFGGLDIDAQGLLWGFQAGQTISPPPPGRTIRFDPKTGVVLHESLGVPGHGLAISRSASVAEIPTLASPALALLALVLTVLALQRLRP